MEDSRATRLVDTALRCYPARWRQRHGEEAAELASLLIKDGTPAGSVALSYLAGAARERLTPRLTAVACALLVAACSLGASAGLLASAVPARAASTYQAHAQCEPGSPASVPVVAQAMNHPELISWEVGHDRSC